MSDRSESRRQSSRSRHSRSGSPRRRHRRKKDFTDEELHELAQKSRDRLALREFMAMVFCHGLSVNGIRRAKKRTDFYLSIKAFLLYIQVICVLLVTFMAVIVFYHINEQEAESAYFATQLFIELILLIALLFMVLFENAGLRYIMTLIYLAAFFTNVVQLSYYLLYDSVALQCERRSAFFGALGCVLRHMPVNHMSTYTSLFLALLHLIGFIAALMLNSFYAGTIEHLMELARAVGFTACLTFLEEHEKRKRRRRRRRREKERKITDAYAPQLDTSKLPVGTVIQTERSSTYKFKGNVQKRGIVVGSGQETVVDSVLVQAPNKEAAKREIKTVRHVMIDGVRRKATTETSKPAQAVEGKQPEKKQQKDQKEEKQQEQKEQTQQSSTKPPPSGKSQQGPAPQQQAGGSWWSLLGGGNLTSGNLQGASDMPKDR